MITMRIKGGLGNQLFQYAAGYALSKRLGMKMSLDITFFPKQTLRGYKLNKLKIKNRKVFNSDQLPLIIKSLKERHINKAFRLMNNRVIKTGCNWKVLLETRPQLTKEFFTINGDNIFVDGYYQSEKYFKKYRLELIEQFKPNYSPENEYLEALKLIQSVNSVAVHVRRGDFIKEQFGNNPRHYLLGEQYYFNALSEMNNRIHNPVYFWFSDDIEWVKQNFGIRENYRFISLSTQNADIDEMMLMKNCNHIITANSTFSWWAAWLNENSKSIIMCPSKPYGIPDMIPKPWIKIMVE